VPDNVLVLDTETTGLGPASEHQIIELTCQEGLGENALQYTWRIRPAVAITPGAQAVHGITIADLAECPPFDAYAGEIRTVIERADVIVGYNVGFDLEMLEEEFRRIDRPLGLANRKTIVDVRGLWLALEPRRLEDAHRRFVGTDYPDAHGSSEDARATGRVLEHLLREFSMEGRGWRELSDLCFPGRERWIGGSKHVQWRAGTAVLTFGKHRDVPVLEVARVSPDYLQWIRDASDLPQHVKAIAKLALHSSSTEEFDRELAERYGEPPEEA
jgi:DNA polymerase-3 subunit epsilon